MIKKKVLSGLLAFSFAGAAVSKPSDRVTEVRYADLASIILNAYSLSETEEALMKKSADHVNLAVQNANVAANQESASNKKLEFKKLSDYERLYAAFKSIQTLRSYRSDDALLHSVLPTVADLEFFNVHAGLFSKIDKTITAPGKIVLAAMITNPLVDEAKIETRKNLINNLLQNEELAAKLEEVVNEFAAYQDAMFSYYSNNASLNALIEKKVLKPYGLDLRKSSMMLNTFHRTADAFPFIAAVVSPIFSAFFKSAFFGGTVSDALDKMYKDDSYFKPKTRAMVLAAIAGSYAYFTQDPERRELVRYIHSRTIALTKVIRSAGKLQDLISSDVSLVQGLKNSTTYSDLLNNKNISSKTFNKIRNELFSSPTFTGEGRYVYVNLGRVLTTDTRIKETLNDFAPLFETIGEIDAYLAITKLVKNSSAGNSQAVFSLIETAKGETEPKLIIENFWHPSLDPKTAVTNTMKLKDGFRGIILTGSNTGGKSTSLKGMLLTALLGQGLGVAAAEKVIMTPFAFIGSFMNITDDIQQKASLFQAEIDRARKLVEIGKDVARHQKFGIVVMDELFTGTNPKQGAIGSERVANKLFINTNLITLFATHYDNMSSLEAQYPNKQVMNYKIDVALNERGRYVHSYKMEPGVSEVSIADYLYDRDL